MASDADRFPEPERETRTTAGRPLGGRAEFLIAPSRRALNPIRRLLVELTTTLVVGEASLYADAGANPHKRNWQQCVHKEGTNVAVDPYCKLRQVN